MTAPESPSSTLADPLTCSVCPHRKADHDAIAARYCSATANSSLSTAKGCVCKPGR